MSSVSWWQAEEKFRELEAQHRKRPHVTKESDREDTPERNGGGEGSSGLGGGAEGVEESREELVVATGKEDGTVAGENESETKE